MERTLPVALGSSITPLSLLVSRPWRARGIHDSDTVVLTHKGTGALFCSHVLSAKLLVQHWRNSATSLPTTEPCPICARNRFYHLKREARMPTGGNGEPMETKDTAVKLQGPPKAAFLRKSIEDHFAPSANPPPGLRVGGSKIYRAGNGLFADRALEKNAELGVYGGTLIYTTREQEESQSDKIMSFDLWGHTVHVDSSKSWHGVLNHQWLWPYLDSAEEVEASRLPAAWQAVFANVNVRSDGMMFTVRDVDQGEELTVDYGFAFWGDIKPVWDMTPLEEGALKQLLVSMVTQPHLRAFRDASGLYFGSIDSLKQS